MALLSKQQIGRLKAAITRYGHPYKPIYFRYLKLIKAQGFGAALACKYLDKVSGWKVL